MKFQLLSWRTSMNHVASQWYIFVNLTSILLSIRYFFTDFTRLVRYSKDKLGNIELVMIKLTRYHYSMHQNHVPQVD